MTLKTGDLAPDFSLPDQNGELKSLSDFSGHYLLLYFYPRDFTPGCTKEACSFRDDFADLKKAGITIVGISIDTQDSHHKFSQKYQIPFILLSDTDKKMSQDYGSWQLKKFMGREYYGIVRSSFLIDPRGKIVKIYPKVKPQEHSQEVLKDIKSI